MKGRIFILSFFGRAPRRRFSSRAGSGYTFQVLPAAAGPGFPFLSLTRVAKAGLDLLHLKKFKDEFFHTGTFRE